MRRLAVFVLLFALAAPAPLALAQDGPAATGSTAAPAEPEHKLPPGFQPIPGAEKRAESVNANLLVVIAYAAFFLGMFGFVIHVVRSQTALAREIAELSGKLERAEKR